MLQCCSNVRLAGLTCGEDELSLKPHEAVGNCYALAYACELWVAPLVLLCPAAPSLSAHPVRCARRRVGVKLVQPQHAAACRSMPQHLFFGAAHGGFEACRSMPQHAAACRSDPKFSRGGLFFSYHVETLNPLLHSCVRTGWQLSGKLLGSRLKGPGFHSWKGYFAACQFLSIVALIFAFLVLF